MGILISGLVLFLGIHLVPTLPAVKLRLVSALGENRYKAVFSVVSGIGLVLIVIGYARAPDGPRVFNPVPDAIQIAPFAMTISFVLLAAANMKTHIRHGLKHPMLIGVAIWAAVHFLANGHAKAALLFGAFLVWAVVDLISAVRRKATKEFEPVVKHDVIAVGAGVVLALVVMTFHSYLFGVPAVSWSD